MCTSVKPLENIIPVFNIKALNVNVKNPFHTLAIRQFSLTFKSYMAILVRCKLISLFLHAKKLHHLKQYWVCSY